MLSAARDLANSPLYPSDSSQLRKAISDCFIHRSGPGKMPPNSGQKSKTVGILVPHGPLAHAGPIAAHCYYNISGIQDPLTVILIGPIHNTSVDTKVVIHPDGEWKTPLGSVKIDENVAGQIAGNIPGSSRNPQPFNSEDCLDMHVPFLQSMFDNLKIVPILMQDQSVDASFSLGKLIGKIAKENKNILVVATSNLTHNMVYAQALRRDAMIYDLLPKPAYLDIKKIRAIVQDNKLTVCGYGPIMTLITAMQVLGCRTGLNVKYGTSGETEGNYASVIGYPATVFVLQ